MPPFRSTAPLQQRAGRCNKKLAATYASGYNVGMNTLNSASILQRLAERELLSALAEHLGLSPQAINPWRRMGRIPAKHIPAVAAFLVAQGLAVNSRATTEAMLLDLLPGDEPGVMCATCGNAPATISGLCRDCRPDRCGEPTVEGKRCRNPRPCRFHSVAK